MAQAHHLLRPWRLPRATGVRKVKSGICGCPKPRCVARFARGSERLGLCMRPGGRGVEAASRAPAACRPVAADEYNARVPRKRLTHLDDAGRVRMVDVGAKPESERWARARASVVLQPGTLSVVRAGELKKGDLTATASLAGIMAAKRTWELIPLCHPIPLTDVQVRLEFSDDLPGIEIETVVRTVGRTGVEMEALTAAAVAGLAVVDMVKAIDRSARLLEVRLAEKHGGQSGDVVLEA